MFQILHLDYLKNSQCIKILATKKKIRKRKNKKEKEKDISISTTK